MPGGRRSDPSAASRDPKATCLHELDGKPALALYKSYLGERAAGLPATALLFPLSMRRDADDAHPLIRTILGVDEAAQSLTFAGDIPEGHLARLMRTNIERLIQSAGHAATDAAQAFPAGSAPLAISVSCVGRRLVLGERTDEEIESVQEALPGGARPGRLLFVRRSVAARAGRALRPAQPDDDRHGVRRGRMSAAGPTRCGSCARAMQMRAWGVHP